ncbi:DNA polymerase epsilon catalytic subunit A [Agrilus planipennis]|uniref:DNA polymerase epsilon catalytic subunit n=1 Tax=Agrilus planipennis TaxID=224129 RepID=A0A7F5RN71_AGRPL|nr:DNA polymerase epsilon catalytic subunit A [Agrilus planipennis]
MLQNTGKYRKERPEKENDKIEIISRENSSEARLRQVIENDNIDLKYGFERIKPHEEKVGYLLNMHMNEMLDEDKRLIAVVDYFFMEEDGTRFKVSYPFMPYFYILTSRELLQEVAQFLSKKYSGVINKIEEVVKEDLDLPNHLIGLKQKYLKLSFLNQNDLQKVRKEILPVIRKNKEKQNKYYNQLLINAVAQEEDMEHLKINVNHLESITDIREYDIPYHVRVAIDLKLFCGSWYKVKTTNALGDPPYIAHCPEIIERPDPIVLAFDIETTKLPLKFPDANTDQIMMISYMIDGQGFLITNREIISQDIEDFEFTPKPEFEGKFTIFNEPNERGVLEKFFEHIMDVRPHIFVTYNGDFFDWPFIEARAAIHELDMKQEIGFFKGRDGVYSSRPAVHMDCICWVKRDSYLPQGSHGLKAVAKAKLRYDPVELDPEEMCPLAADQPQVLCNYSVSDAVATYYLYMQYVHPFIFALCTIIPCEPDEVLRKGSGTLCESLLMVQAFHKNIIFPNKEEQILNKLTEDGHLLHQETYVGGHVEALESGVFRADIPCRFRIETEAVDKLIANVFKTLTHAIEIEEGVPLEHVTNLQEIKDEIVSQLEQLKEKPLRLEKPLIYHLDVGAMYPNIILTNRLQPCAIVNEHICAACDFNKPQAVCQRKMEWIWRGEFMPATKNEYFRIQQQLETEKFPPLFPGKPQRAFHELSRQEQAELEKKRLSVYCRKVYKKQKVTKTETRTTTICQKENSFYVDTVRAFRDRRYEYKALSKQAKKMVSDAVKGGNAVEIKSAKNREVLYDSLQLAHKCILNSFYGYVMRRGARWHSMEMAGIVCYTGANIIMMAREIIEKVGRPLELDTDGIWCILPSSFPENVTVHTSNEKKKKLIISYPNAVLNAMVKEHFTNNQYHELVDSEMFEYEIRSENSIFFEVDGPYKAMVLPASKEEGKRLKKRYAVFNFDGTLAELKGFEVKRRGELQLIKNFQSSVFEAFLKGDSLQSCYAAVAQVANYWLDVLYSRGRNLPDTELFELISENKSMSRKLEDYGEQKSTSISTAKRLAEFLGDQMVKDAGLACKYIIAKKPEGAPVTERAIPLAIFQADDAVQKHFLRKWLKDNSLGDFDIREILDWNYYIERLGGAIQKIITIPAAMQGIANPVPRVQHPEWLHKRVLEKNDNFKQRKINDMFTACAKPHRDSSESGHSRDTSDIEDIGKFKSPPSTSKVGMVTKRKRQSDSDNEFQESDLGKSWRTVLGLPPPFGKTREEIVKWIEFHKKKWRFMALQKGDTNQYVKRSKQTRTGAISGTLGGFIQKSQRTRLLSCWQILQIVPTSTPGIFKLWVLIQSELYQLKLNIPRIFYVNLRTPKRTEDSDTLQKCNRTLPRSRPVFNLYKQSIPELTFIERGKKEYVDQTDPNVEGVYELQVPLLFRSLVFVGCVCKVLPDSKNASMDTFNLDKLEMTSISKQPYLEDGCIKHIFLYQHRLNNKSRQMFGLFLTPLNKSIIIVVDSVRTNLMPHMNNLYQAERKAKIERKGKENVKLPPEIITFEIRVETDLKQVYKAIQKALQMYKDEKKGPTMVAVQSYDELSYLQAQISNLNEYPTMQVHVKDMDDLYNNLEWQKIGARALVRHYLNSEEAISLTIKQCRYFHLPVGNMPSDPALFGADLMFARHLIKQNHVLWCSPTERPDLGGSQENDARLLAETRESSSEVCNNPGWYSSVCIELAIDSLAINTLLQSHHITDMEGTSSSVAFDNAAPQSLDEMIGGQTSFTPYDESSKCAEAFRILRIMVTAWMRDITLYRNVFADFQVVHFYRWLRAPQALLYDPALLRTLQNLMKKLFIQLVAEFKRLGCTIVYANFDKIVICSRKTKVEDAIANIEFVVASLRNRELFHSLEITYRQCWEQLIWLDSANYGGIEGKLPKGLESECGLTEELQNIQEADSENDPNEPMVVMNWNIAEQLPETAGCRNSFKAIVAGYIHAIHLKLKETESSNVPVTLSQPSLGLTAHKDVVEFARELISRDISQNLFLTVEKLNSRLPAENKDGHFPTLDFINSICHILGLDPAVRDVVDNLKSDLLRLVAVGEFSDKASFKDRTVSYVIPQIICKACNHCRDVDLGRDSHRSDSAWLCPLCNSPYDNSEIENQLLDIITRKMITYNLQDLQCKKCSQIKLENLTTRCSCAGEFRCLISANDLIELLQTFQRLAESFDMSALYETVHQVLKLA